MATQILMPALSPTMEEGKLAKWLVHEGDVVKSGDVLAEIETDKATMEFEAVDEGRIGKILVPEGSEGVKVNQPIAELVSDGEEATASAPVPLTPTLSPQGGEGDSAKHSLAPVGGEGKGEGASPQAPNSPEETRDPEIPAGTEFVTMTVREALR